MSDAIIVALITGGASVLCQIILSRRNRKDTESADAAARQRINDRLDAIERKLDIHNGYAEKLGSISTEMAVMATEIKNLKGGQA